MTLSRPHFVVIGAMKCATSTLHDQLAAQPGIWMSTPKEPNFFSDDDVFARGLSWYASLFEGAPPGDLCGESSTHYTKLPTHPHAIPRMSRHLGDSVRFVYLMRHPVERLIAHYVHAWTEGVLDVDIDRAVEIHPPLVEYGCYARQIEPYLEAFGRSRVLPVFLEHLKAHPQAALERVARFVGYERPVHWQPDLSRRNVSSQRMRQSPLRDRLVAAPGLRWLRRRLVPTGWRERAKDLWRMRERPVPSDATRKLVEDHFDRDLARLGAWLGAPLDCARFAAVVAEAPLEWRP